MKKIFKAAVLITTALAAAIAFSGCEQANVCNYDEAASTLSCPEKVYKTMKIGEAVWTAENMGTYIPDSSVCYGNDHANCDQMGRLYTWNAANTALCPNGWALPSQKDYQAAFGKATVEELKKASSFNVKFAGFRYFDGKFADKDASASFWTNEAYDDSRAYLVRITDSTITYEHFNKSIAASVRCIKK